MPSPPGLLFPPFPPEKFAVTFTFAAGITKVVVAVVGLANFTSAVVVVQFTKV